MRPMYVFHKRDSNNLTPMEVLEHRGVMPLMEIPFIPLIEDHPYYWRSSPGAGTSGMINPSDFRTPAWRTNDSVSERGNTPFYTGVTRGTPGETPGRTPGWTPNRTPGGGRTPHTPSTTPSHYTPRYAPVLSSYDMDGADEGAAGAGHHAASSSAGGVYTIISGDPRICHSAVNSASATPVADRIEASTSEQPEFTSSHPAFTPTIEEDDDDSRDSSNLGHVPREDSPIETENVAEEDDEDGETGQGSGAFSENVDGDVTELVGDMVDNVAMTTDSTPAYSEDEEHLESEQVESESEQVESEHKESEQLESEHIASDSSPKDVLSEDDNSSHAQISEESGNTHNSPNGTTTDSQSLVDAAEEEMADTDQSVACAGADAKAHSVDRMCSEEGEIEKESENAEPDSAQVDTEERSTTKED